MTSFVTCVKLCPGYEDYLGRLKVYVENIVALCTSPFEIIIVEEKVDVFKVAGQSWASHARVVEYTPSYRNPHGYNMIEAFAKNVGISMAKYPYVCVTNADVFFDAAFFENIKNVNHETFYRFKEYEVPVPPEWSWEVVEKTMSKEKRVNAVLDSNTVQGIAFKSGDVMLMHKDLWQRIGGYPENEVWVHSDLIVCVVVSNNGITVNVPDGGVYTYVQARERKEAPHEIQTALLYATSLTTKPLPCR